MLYTTWQAASYHFHNFVTVCSNHSRYYLYRYLIEDTVVIVAAAVEFANLSLSSMSYNLISVSIIINLLLLSLSTLYLSLLSMLSPLILFLRYYYNGVIMSAVASQITGVSIVYSTVCSDSDQRKHQSSASLAFVRGIRRWPVNSPHKWPVTRKIFPFNDVSWRQWITFWVGQVPGDIYSFFFKITGFFW